MKLRAKGHNPYLSFSHSPDIRAANESETLFEATEEAAMQMLDMVADENPVTQKAGLELLVAVRHLHKRMAERVEKIDLMIQVAEIKIEEGLRVLEGSGAPD